MLYEFYMNKYIDYIEKEAEKERTKVLAKFASFLSQPNSVDIIAKIIAAGSLEENPDALKIIDKLNIDKLEILSLVNDELFKIQYEKEAQYTAESELYHNHQLFGG